MGAAVVRDREAIRPISTSNLQGLLGSYHAYDRYNAMNTTKSRDPLLSIIIPGRNDGFMMNFNYRLQTTLDYLARNLKVLGRLKDVEIVIGDWGSDVPLHEVLSISDEAKEITRYVVIPPQYAKPLQGDAEFPIVMVQNAAIRRCLGRYIMQTDSDVLFTQEFLAKLFNLLEGTLVPGLDLTHALFGSKRGHVPWSVVQKCPSIDQLDVFVHKHGHELQVDVHHEFKYCATGMMFMHRDTWNECSGYDERLTHWGWMEIDLGMRITQRYPYIDVTEAFGMLLFHLEHYPHTGEGRKSSRKMNVMNRPTAFRPNGDLWGFPTLEFSTYYYANPTASSLAPDKV